MPRPRTLPLPARLTVATAGWPDQVIALNFATWADRQPGATIVRALLDAEESRGPKGVRWTNARPYLTAQQRAQVPDWPGVTLTLEVDAGPLLTWTRRTLDPLWARRVANLLLPIEMLGDGEPELRYTGPSVDVIAFCGNPLSPSPEITYFADHDGTRDSCVALLTDGLPARFLQKVHTAHGAPGLTLLAQLSAARTLGTSLLPTLAAVNDALTPSR